MPAGRKHGSGGAIKMDATDPAGAAATLVGDLNAWTLDMARDQVDVSAFGAHGCFALVEVGRVGDEGTMAANFPNPGELHVELASWHNHHPQACRVIGFTIQHTLRNLGYRAMEVTRTRCVASGHAECAFSGTYLP